MNPGPRAWRVWKHSRWGRTLTRWLGGTPTIPTALWERVVSAQPFLSALPPWERHQLKPLCERFLADKEFTGAHGLVITDEMAVTVAAQACLPWVHWGLPGLDWYRRFVGIVIHPDEVVAEREVRDDAGVVHHYQEALAGEAMHGGPVMLAWKHARGTAASVSTGHSLVIHEFAHLIDMRHKSQSEEANGCPKLPRGYMGLTPSEAADLWHRRWSEAYQRLVRDVEMASRFGTAPPWLDAYGAQSPAEFFAVACEAYFVNRPRFNEEFGDLVPLLDAFFRHPDPSPVNDATVP